MSMIGLLVNFAFPFHFKRLVYVMTIAHIAALLQYIQYL